MSRSYKEPIIADYSRNRTRQMKRLASKAVRREEVVPADGGYKKVFDSCDIRDYKSYCYAKAETATRVDPWGRLCPTMMTKDFEAKARRK